MTYNLDFKSPESYGHVHAYAKDRMPLYSKAGLETDRQTRQLTIPCPLARHCYYYYYYFFIPQVVKIPGVKNYKS